MCDACVVSVRFKEESYDVSIDSESTGRTLLEQVLVKIGSTEELGCRPSEHPEDGVLGENLFGLFLGEEEIDPEAKLQDDHDIQDHAR